MDDVSRSSLEAGRAAVRGHEWERAFSLLSTADAEAPLAPEELEALGEAAWVTSRYEEFFRAYERAYAAYVARGETHAAAWVATMLANEYFPRGELAVGAGWHHTAARLLDGQPEGRAHALHAWTHAQLALIERDLKGALAHSEQMSEIGERVGDLDLALLGRATQGRALVQLGRVEEATAAIDEAMAVAVSGRLRPRTACLIYCQTLTVAANSRTTAAPASGRLPPRGAACARASSPRPAIAASTGPASCAGGVPGARRRPMP